MLITIWKITNRYGLLSDHFWRSYFPFILLPNSKLKLFNKTINLTVINLTIWKLAILFKTSNWDFFCCIFCYYPFKAQFQIDWNMKIIFDVKFYFWFMDGSYCYLILHGIFFSVSNLTSLLLGHFFSNSMNKH